MQRKRVVPAVVAQIFSGVRRLGRGSCTLCVGTLAFGVMQMAGSAAQMAQAPVPPAAAPVQLAAAAPAQPAPPAAAPQAPAHPEAKPEQAQPQQPAPEAEKAAPVPAPATPAPAPAAARPEAPAPAAAPPKPTPLTPEEKLKKVYELLLQANPARKIPNSPYGELIYDIAVRHSINPHLVAAMIHVESAFNPRAVSRKGAMGLMQLLPETARRFGLKTKKDLFVPEKNLEAGIRYLKWLNKRFGGDVEKILAAYNAGEGAVDRFGGIPPYRETQNYVKKIFNLLNFTLPSLTLDMVPGVEPGGVGEMTLAR